MDHHLVFSINSGRAGSQYLARLLSTGVRVTAFHEPEPTMSGKPLEMTNALPMQATRDVRRAKNDAIRAVLNRMQAGETYVETNHMFIKTFYDVVLEEFAAQTAVVVLRRELALVLKSFIEMGYFSPLNSVWEKWMSSPESVNAALPLPMSYSEMDQYDRSIAYLLDIEARVTRFQQEYPNVPLYEARVETLSAVRPAASLFRELGISPSPRTLIYMRRRYNTRQSVKRHISNPTQLGYCRERLGRYIELLSDRGIPVPPGAALDSIAHQ